MGRFPEDSGQVSGRQRRRHELGSPISFLVGVTGQGLTCAEGRVYSRHHAESSGNMNTFRSLHLQERRPGKDQQCLEIQSVH